MDYNKKTQQMQLKRKRSILTPILRKERKIRKVCHKSLLFNLKMSTSSYMMRRIFYVYMIFLYAFSDAGQYICMYTCIYALTIFLQFLICLLRAH